MRNASCVGSPTARRESAPIGPFVMAIRGGSAPYFTMALDLVHKNCDTQNKLCLIAELFPRPPILSSLPEVPIHTFIVEHLSAILADRTWATVWPRVAFLPTWHPWSRLRPTCQRAQTSC